MLFTAPQLRRCADAAHVLAAARTYADADAWRADACAALRRAFAADHAFVELPGAARRIVGDGVDGATLERLAAYSPPAGPRYADPALERLHQRRLRRPDPVVTRVRSERAMGRPLDGTEIWDAVVRPAGMLHFQGAFVDGALFWTSRERPSRAAPTGEDAAPLVELLVPAFRAGLHALGRRPLPAERWGLTPREAEVARLLARGHTAKRIAAALGITPHTASRHTERILAKLGVSTRTAAAHRLNG
jgi:DNA-binding CsgD family transcriptional regulator